MWRLFGQDRGDGAVIFVEEKDAPDGAFCRGETLVVVRRPIDITMHLSDSGEEDETEALFVQDWRRSAVQASTHRAQATPLVAALSES